MYASFFIAFFMLAGFLSGCAVPSVRAYANGVVKHGSTVADMKKRACNVPTLPCQDWTKPDYHRPETGNPVYREITNPYCWYHWEVDWKADPKGRIIGWRAEGSGCDLLVPRGKLYSPWFGSEAALPSTK
jgi:hypothetical protein